MRVSSYRVVFFVAVAFGAVSILVTDSFSHFLPGLVGVAIRDAGSNPLAASSRVPEQRAILGRLKRANMTAELSPGALDSYRTDTCIFVGSDALAGKVQKGCIKGTLGILLPSSAYLKTARVAELANAQGGWRITPAPLSVTGPSTQTATKLADPKLSALKEQIAHSLVSLFRLLDGAKESDLSKLKLNRTSSHIVVTWAEGGTSNQFFFNLTGLHCDKQIRTTPVGVTAVRYSEYKNVNGAMLPFRIEMEGPSGKVMAVQVVESWTLGATWPADFFTPEGFHF